MTTLIYHDPKKLREAELAKLPVVTSDERPTIRRVLAQHGSTLDILSSGVQTSLLSQIHALRQTADDYLYSPFIATQQLNDLRRELKRIKENAAEVVALAESVLADL